MHRDASPVVCLTRHHYICGLLCSHMLQAQARIVSWAAAGAAVRAPWASQTRPPASWMSRLAAAAAQAGSPLEVAGAGGIGCVAELRMLIAYIWHCGSLILIQYCLFSYFFNPLCGQAVYNASSPAYRGFVLSSKATLLSILRLIHTCGVILTCACGCRGRQSQARPGA